jgi:ATP-binding cassette subfamily B protein
VVDEVSLCLEPGKVVCLTGPNGSGKSTIVNLILGFYAPWKGEIYAGDHSYRELDMRLLRQSIGVVLQDVIIFPGTIRENITYGCSSRDQKKIGEVLNLTGCSDFIAKLPEGLETCIENRGENLSGGEMQRIAIARALLGDNKLIIFDELSSHLDRRGIKQIIENLKNYLTECSILIISHDREVIDNADEIIELMDRKVSKTDP